MPTPSGSATPCVFEIPRCAAEAPGKPRQTPRRDMRDCDRAFPLQKEHRHGLADNVGLADHDRIEPTIIVNHAVQQQHAADGSAHARAVQARCHAHDEPADQIFDKHVTALWIVPSVHLPGGVA